MKKRYLILGIGLTLLIAYVAANLDGGTCYENDLMSCECLNGATVCHAKVYTEPEQTFVDQLYVPSEEAINQCKC